MDFLKAEIERKRKQLETSGLAPENKKYFSRRDLVTKNEEEYLRRSGLIRVSESDSSAKGEGENSSSEVQGRSGEHVREKSEKSSSEESQPILPRKEVIRRLRERSEPIRLFGENDGDAFERLKTLEIQRPEVIKGFRNDFKAAMDRVDKAYLDEILKQTGKDQEANDATEEGEGGESSTEAKDSKQSGATSTDKVMTLEEIQELAKDMGKGNESIDGRVILSFFQLILRKWDEEIKTAKKEGMMEVKNKMAAATHAQTVQYLRPLFARLRKCKLSEDILDSLREITKALLERNYIFASDQYLQMAIGNAPWPIGVTMVGIHARTGREKIFSKNVAHVLNDETQRKYIQGLKRLMTKCQEIYPADPSKSFEYNGLVD